MTGNLKFIEPATQEEFEKYYRLRYEILRKPWNQPENTTKDEWENNSFHLLVLDENGNAVATGRMQYNPDSVGQVRSMAVREDWQGKGIGSLILGSIEEIAKKNNIKKIILDARQEAVGFYERNGYKVVGDSYLLFGTIQHSSMEKILAAI